MKAAVAGRKPLALLIPGLDGTGLLYYRQVKPLEERYRVLPWWFQPRSEFGYGELIAELAQATSEEPPSSVVVVGESFGGTIALHFALTHPEKVNCLVLVNSFAVYTRRLRIRLGCLLAPLLLWRGMRKLKNFIVDRILALEGIPLEDRYRYRELIKQVYHPAYCKRLQLVRDVDLRAKLSLIAVPTLLFASGRDKIVPSVEEARFMSTHIPDADLYEFPGAGHALLLTPGFVLAEYLK
jgi:pimeloyl-ACP methyl ester carboxylesterase